MLKDKVILVDADGVLFDWEYAFDCWMNSNGYATIDSSQYKAEKRYAGLQRPEAKSLIRHFNESASIGFLPPLRDSVYYIKQLHEKHGYVFHCITSLSLNPFAQKLRENNIRKLFGEMVFERIVCLDTGADKDDALEEYKNSECFWVEDKIENAELGLKLGLNSILMAHSHNADYQGECQRVQNWKEIYSLVTAV